MRKHGMNKFLLTIMLLGSSVLSYAASSVVIGGVRYTLSGKNEATARAAKSAKKGLVDVSIPEIVKIEGEDCFVTKIDKSGFEDCKNLRYLSLPNTVKRIGDFAFWGCTALESVVMPDEAVAVVAPGAYGFQSGGYFQGMHLADTCSRS